MRNPWRSARSVGVAGAAALAGLVVLHGIVLPRYAGKVDRQPGTLRLVRNSDVALQWHEDARIEMEGARDFPRALSARAHSRRNRPLYCGVGSALFRCARPLAGAAAETRDDQARLAGWCLIATNAAYLALTAALFFDAVRRALGPLPAAVSVLLLLSIRFLHRYAAVAMTHAYIHLPAALLLWLAVRWAQQGRADERRHIAAAAGWGVLYGVFYLFKQNVAVAASLVGVLLVLRRWRSAMACVAGLPVAYAVYRALLAAAGIAYANQEVDRYRHGMFVLDALRSGRGGSLFVTLGRMLEAIPGGLWTHFGWILPAAAAGMGWVAIRARRGDAFCRRACAFVLLLLAAAAVQAYGSRRYGVSYIWAELYIVFCPLAALALVEAGAAVARRWPALACAAWLVPSVAVAATAMRGYQRLVTGPAAGWLHVLACGLGVAALSAAYSAAVSFLMKDGRSSPGAGPHACM